VTCVEKDVCLVAGLGEGRMPIYEPGLKELMAKNADRLRFTTDLASMLHETDVVFIAVDTPRGRRIY
jgi:UDPglucose 6-dehydrogenase